MSTGDQEFGRLLASAARAMQGETGPQNTLDMAVATAPELIGGCDLVGISVVHPDGIDTPASSDDAVKLIDELQYDLQQGPCLSALQEHETVHSPDVAEDERWPDWGRRVADELGVGSVVSYRLFTAGPSLGALNLYSRKVRGFDTDDIYHGLALAAHVAVALAGAQKAEHLERAITNRTVIGQAEGILMERYDLSAHQAFDVLRRVSSHTNTKLSSVAQELVETRETPG